MRGAIKWMAGNHVAANILMIFFIIGGLIIGKNIKHEVFPEFELDRISVTVAYPGASPIDVEDGIIRPVEHAVSGVDNVKRITSTANENVGVTIIELIEGSDVSEVLNDVKAEIDRILTFPDDAEEAVVSKLSNRREVITLVIHGDISERALFEHTQRVQDDLLDMPNITQVDVSAVRPPEISIEINEANLRQYNLTLNQVSSIVRQASLDMPGGSVKTEGGEVLIRTNQKRYTGSEFDSIAVLNSPSGRRVLLEDIATINDGFAEADLEAIFDGQLASMVKVFRVGKQKPGDISKTVREYIEKTSPRMPPNVSLTIGQDWSIILSQRLDLLLRNGRLGFILVLIILSLFLEIRLAFWVAAGAGISFVGALLFLPMLDVSINMLSLFAFLIVIGVVVDDAIIVGENIHVHYKSGKPVYKAAVDGTIEVTKAVVFAILTSIAAFSPLLFVSGSMGKLMSVIPTIVICVLLISLIESLFILPAHLSGGLIKSKANIWTAIEKRRAKVDKVVSWLIDNTYQSTLKWVAENRYITVAISVAILLITFGIISSGFIKFIFMPKIDADFITVKLTMAPGTPFEETREVARMLLDTGVELAAVYDARRDDGKSDLLHTFLTIGSHQESMSHDNLGPTLATNLAQISMLFTTSDERLVNLPEFSRQWRERIGEVPGIERLTFQSDLMRQTSDIDIQLAHDDYTVLLTAVERVREALSEYSGVEEINDSYSEGKRELKLRLRPEAASLGITETDLALQVRSAFYGAEALRLQRGRNEIKVMVRYPEEDRKQMSSVEDMRLRTPEGGEIPFAQAAYVNESRGYNVINRANRKRVIDVTANVDRRIVTSGEIIEDLQDGLLTELTYEFPGLSFDLEGEARDREESMSSLRTGFLIAMFLIYALLAIPFSSFTQPFVVMSAIPFGIVGAVFGHMILGFDLSLLSMFGIVALSGIVVNDSLIFIDFINKSRAEGNSIQEAVIKAGKRRFRPIVLTSLTTFFGLMPIILETSIQARFLIPMAISLGFGVLFATGITLVLIPAEYLILEDILRFFRGSSVEEAGE